MVVALITGGSVGWGVVFWVMFIGYNYSVVIYLEIVHQNRYKTFLNYLLGSLIILDILEYKYIFLVPKLDMVVNIVVYFDILFQANTRIDM